MSKTVYVTILSGLLLLGPLSGCRQRVSPAGQPESREAKRLLQGLWNDEETEAPVFKLEGDSVYYPDSTSMNAYFKVVGDTLYIGPNARYHIEKHTEHLLWFHGANGEQVRLVKNDDAAVDSVYELNKPQILTLTEVLKRDTVAYYEGTRYHFYVAVNPTRYQVKLHTLNDDGLDVENVYYDNIIHLSIYKGSERLFSRDFRKQMYGQRVPAPFFEIAILNDMQFSRIDAQGFHVHVSLCAPGDASCYLLEHVISFDGKLSTQLIEY